jgi:transposase
MHFTKGFEVMALLLLREMPVATVASFLDETDTRLWRMIFAHVDAAYRRKDMSEVTCVGVDEMSIRKGHEYLTIFADLKQKTVLFATEGKDKSTWERFIAEWEKHEGHRHQLTCVSMDMSKAYRAGRPRMVSERRNCVRQVPCGFACERCGRSGPEI